MSLGRKAGVQGDSIDLDVGAEGPRVPSFDLFARMMNEPRCEGLLFGDISVITQVNRVGPALKTVIEATTGNPGW